MILSPGYAGQAQGLAAILSATPGAAGALDDGVVEALLDEAAKLAEGVHAPMNARPTESAAGLKAAGSTRLRDL